MVTKIIGLAGKSGSGKDVVADYIGERYGYRKIAVADAIRDEVADYLYETLPDDMPEHIKAQAVSGVYDKPTTQFFRVMLQWWGTEYRRSTDPDYWVNILKEKISKMDFVVVSDVRLPIEVDAIHEAGGEVWFVERPGVAPVGLPGHLTEVALDGVTFDRTITNDKSLADLRAKVDYVFQEC